MIRTAFKIRSPPPVLVIAAWYGVHFTLGRKCALCRTRRRWTRSSSITRSSPGALEHTEGVFGFALAVGASVARTLPLSPLARQSSTLT